jgi:hypothetical protein
MAKKTTGQTELVDTLAAAQSDFLHMVNRNVAEMLAEPLPTVSCDDPSYWRVYAMRLRNKALGLRELLSDENALLEELVELGVEPPL